VSPKLGRPIPVVKKKVVVQSPVGHVEGKSQRPVRRGDATKPLRRSQQEGAVPLLDPPSFASQLVAVGVMESVEERWGSNGRARNKKRKILGQEGARSHAANEEEGVVSSQPSPVPRNGLRPSDILASPNLHEASDKMTQGSSKDMGRGFSREPASQRGGTAESRRSMGPGGSEKRLMGRVR
jgi:hypothetical protein